MGRKRRNDAPGLIHHVYCRGNRGEPVFETEGDYEAFTRKLFELSLEARVEILAFCLMPNHFHLCLRTREDGKKLSKFMQRLNLWHARFFNLRHRVRGRLNESRYRAKVVDSEQYLLTLIRYIHLNPIRAELVQTLDAWKHSSHAAYLGGTNPGVVTADVLRLAGGAEGYRELFKSVPLTPEDLERLRFPRRKMPVVLAPGAAVAPEISGPLGARIRVAYALRMQGLSSREIAIRLQTSKTTVARLLQAVAPRPTTDSGAASVCHEEEAVYRRAA